ncbi:MFS transporter, partial [Sciscionella sediminilitoris]|uniref:MFS transporter n=1 Tax=Sciscionella sediminilitoris TaxID=1445613 RepID=UPI0004DF8202
MPHRAVLVLVCAAQFLCVLDDTIVNVALPSIQRGLGFSAANLPWVVNAYLVSFGGLLLLGGRAADLFARRAVFLTGLAVFGTASLVCGFAETPGALVGARIAQGAGAAFMSAAALAILSVTFTGAARHRAFGVWGGLSGVAGALGMLLGGALTTWLSWRWVFLLNVPVVLLVAVLGPRFLPAARSAKGATLDPFGAITATGGLGLLILAIAQARVAGWGSGSTLGCLAGAAVLLAGFLVIESRHRAPLVPLHVFRLRTVGGGIACGLLLAGAMLALFFFLTLYLQRVLGYRPLQAGLAYLPMSLTVLLVAGFAARVIHRFGHRAPLITGFTLIAAALLWFARLPAGGGYLAHVLGPALLAGAGLGTTLVGVVTVTTAELGGDGTAGLASGLVNTTQQLGGALGIAALSAITFTTAEAAPAVLAAG